MPCEFHIDAFMPCHYYALRHCCPFVTRLMRYAIYAATLFSFRRLYADAYLRLMMILAAASDITCRRHKMSCSLIFCRRDYFDFDVCHVRCHTIDAAAATRRQLIEAQRRYAR